jgi:tetratricopeptide (TPR) repeat protein
MDAAPAGLVRLTARAAEAARRAADGDRLAWADAARWYRLAGHHDRAAQALGRAPPGPAADVERAWQLLERGDVAGAVAACADAPHTAAWAAAAVAAGRADALPAPTEADDLELRLVRSAAALHAGDLPRAAALAGAAARSAHQVGDACAEARAWTLAGRALLDARDYARAQAAHTAGLALHRALGCLPGVAASLGGLGLCDLATGHGVAARGAQRLTQAATLAAELADDRAEAAWRTHLDHALAILGRTEQRTAELRRFREVVRRLGDLNWEGSLWDAEAACWDDLGDAGAAEQCRQHARRCSEAQPLIASSTA